MVAPSSSWYSVSPTNSSPLTHPPYLPSRSPSPSNPYDADGQSTGYSTPMPIPVRLPSFSDSHYMPVKRDRHVSSIPSPLSSVSLDGPLPTSQPYPSPTQSSQYSFHTPSSSSSYQRRLSASSQSHSRSLAGSYTLSLLSARMSIAHPPHSVPSHFVLQIGSSSFATSPSPSQRQEAVGERLGSPQRMPAIPTRLKSPPQIRVGFEARWHDLQGGPGGAAVGTPWVGCVDVEEWYYDKFTQDTEDDERDCFLENELDRRKAISTQGPAGSMSVPRSLPPPPFPGYEVAYKGMLQLVVKNQFHALKIFLINYDLSTLVPGGKMLVRERGYEEILPRSISQSGSGFVSTENGSDKASRRVSTGSMRGIGDAKAEGRREVLRFAVELQFTCVALEPKKGKQSIQRERIDNNGHPDVRHAEKRVALKKKLPGKAYFLSKHIRIVFPPLSGNKEGGAKPSSIPSSSSTGSIQPKSSKDNIRMERFIEVVNPAEVHEGMSIEQLKKLRRGSLVGERWEGIRDEWKRRMEAEAEEERMEAEGQRNDDMWQRDGRANTIWPAREKSGIASSDKSRDEDFDVESSIQPVATYSFARSSTPVPGQSGRPSSLLTARLEKYATTDITTCGVDQSGGRESEALKVPARSPTPTTPRAPQRHYRGFRMEDESDRMLSESFQKLPLPFRPSARQP